jgi:dTDP-4-amino-4,6-dideoxygalactose transaminase
MNVPFFRLSFTSAEEKHVLEVIRSGWVTTGPKAKELEERIAAMTGAKYSAAVSSGTAGLHLTLDALGTGIDDEIISTPFTMAATIEAIMYSGARPVLVDILPGTLNINPAFVERKINKKTRAIVTVDIAGCPCEYDHLRRIAHDHGISLIADAAHSLGARYKDKPVGSLADATVFSFYSTKNITTGEGGMVVSDSKELIDKVRRLSLHGMTSSGWKRYRGGGWRYDITELGYKYNMSDLAAALGLGQLDRFDELQRKRNQLARRYIDNLISLDEYIELPYCDDDITHAWHLFIIKLVQDRWKIGRDELIEKLEKNGVGCGVHFIPIYHFSYFKKILSCSPADFPNCESAFERVISLPFYPDLRMEEVDYVCKILKELAEEYST